MVVKSLHFIKQMNISLFVVITTYKFDLLYYIKLAKANQTIGKLLMCVLQGGF